MNALPPDLEALMPEPIAFARKWHADGEKPAKVAGKWPGKFKLHAVSERQCLPDDAPLFTADQVRAAILGATERAAKQHLDTEKALLWCVRNLTEYGHRRMLSDPSNGVMRAVEAIRGAEKEGAKGS